MSFTIDTFDFNSNKTFIIAELSGNHNGDIELAKKTIRAAAKAGADCVKLQTYTADTLTLNVRNEHFLVNHGTEWDGEYLYDLFEKAHTPWEWHKELFDCAKEAGVIYFSSPFDPTAVDFLESLHVPAYKIASYEITDIPLIKYVASKQKPIIISTGIADESDIQLALEACHSQGNKQIALLMCTSSYPTPPEEAHLLNISVLHDKFGVVPGFSDHTMGIEAPVVAVAMGARIIEKHIILDRALGGVDSHFSLDIDEFKQMVDSVRKAEKMLGKVGFEMTKKKQINRQHARSLYLCKAIEKGEVFTAEHVRSVRPGNGMHPKFLEQIIGKAAVSAFKAGIPMSQDMIA